MVPAFADRSCLAVDGQLHAERVVIVLEEPAGEVAGFDQSLGIDDFGVLDPDLLHGPDQELRSEDVIDECMLVPLDGKGFLVACKRRGDPN